MNYKDALTGLMWGKFSGTLEVVVGREEGFIRKEKIKSKDMFLLIKGVWKIDGGERVGSIN